MLPNPPSPNPDLHELADFAEILCLKNDKVSARELIAYLGRVDDNAHNIGCDDDDSENEDLVSETMNEMDRRKQACGRGYPFRFEMQGKLMEHPRGTSTRSLVYRYLLLSTRLNMTTSRNQGGIDGALLLEELSAHVLKNYLGERAKTIVFGTAAGGGFQDRINAMCAALKEGVQFCSLDNAPVRAKDDHLDVVGWVPFVDEQPSQLIVFGQCKTGSSYGDDLQQLQPQTFWDKWVEVPAIVPPVRAFCVAEAADRSRWKEIAREAGILLDRCRLVDFSDGLPRNLKMRIERWTAAATGTLALLQQPLAQRRRRAKTRRRKKR